jgi:6-phosphogluconolactonase
MKSILALLLLASFTACAQIERFYVGTYTDKSPSRGIYTGTLDADTGKLGPLELASPAKNPSFLALAPDGKFLYAIAATNGGSVAAYRVENDGHLTWLNDLPAGSGGCHVAVDATGKNVFVANYGGGSVASFQTQTNGALAKRTALIPFNGAGPDPQRQSKPYAHSTYTDAGNRHLYACDLGTDSVWLFDWNAATGTLKPANPPAAKVPPGSGPRHLAFTPDQAFAYVNGEMGMNVTAFARDPQTGALTARQTLSTLPPDVDANGLTTAEIFCHPSGKYLYVSNRDVIGHGRDSLAVYAVGADGTLTWLQNAPAGVKVPRGFNLDPTGRWLVVGGQGDNQITVHKIDAATGRLSPTGQTAAVGAPVCVIFAGH